MTTNLSTEDYFHQIRNIYSDAGQANIAEGQVAYMKDKFDFFGIKAPVWAVLLRAFFKENGVFASENLKEFARMCFSEPQRELHYLAIEMCQKAVKNEQEDFIYFLEELILSKSWWDSVDWLAKLVAGHFERFPHQIRPITEGWLASENMWLQRTAITFQRYYKGKTDAEMLFEYVKKMAHSKQFFIQKGSGWALREYAKINPQAVLDFVKTNDLPPLTNREAVRLIQ